MRLLFRLIILTILGFSQTINDELKELNGATPARRVELMNHIKEQLIIMNQQERSETIAKLRAKLQPSSSHQPNQYNQISHIHKIVPNHIPIHNNHQEIQIYQEHIPDIITHREHIHKTPTVPSNTNTNHNEPIDRTPTVPTNTNTNHNEPVDRTPTVPTNTNTNHNQPVDRTPTIPTNTNTNHNLSLIHI